MTGDQGDTDLLSYLGLEATEITQFELSAQNQGKTVHVLIAEALRAQLKANPVPSAARPTTPRKRAQKSDDSRRR